MRTKWRGLLLPVLRAALSWQKGKEPPGLSVTVLLHKERPYIADYLDLLNIYAIGHDSKISDLNVCFMDTVLSTSLRVRARVIVLLFHVTSSPYRYQ